jgi:ABC-type nitrate/sulfonate/bicarbonate transport system substrate-binding protein
MHERSNGRLFRFTATLATAMAIALVTATCSSASTPSTKTSSGISASRCAANRAAGTVTYVSPFGFGPIPGILEMFAAEKLGYFSDVCLTVNIVTSSYTPNELVSAGTAQITSEGSAADTLVAVAGGAHLVAVATLADTSSYVLLTHPDITNLKQLEGKSLAYHTAMPVVLTEMLDKAGVDLSKVTLINDNSYDPTLLPDGKFDALQAYEENEPLTLKADKLPFKEWYPAQFGIQGTFNTVVVNGTFLKKHPTATADFLRAELHAFDYCEGHVAVCVGYERTAAAAAGSTFDVSHAIAEWNLSVGLMKHHALAGLGIGVQTKAEWQPEATALATYKVLKSVPTLAKAMDTKIAASLYSGTKLVWPGP